MKKYLVSQKIDLSNFSRKKIIVLSILCFYSFFGLSQKLTKKISEISITGFYKVEYMMKVDVEKEDTTYIVYSSFQNRKYSTITDIGSIFITDKETLNNLIKDLKLIIEQIDAKVDFDIKRDDYELSLSDELSKQLFIFDDDGKYTVISKKGTVLWLQWLESLDKSKLK